MDPLAKTQLVLSALRFASKNLLGTVARINNSDPIRAAEWVAKFQAHTLMLAERSEIGVERGGVTEAEARRVMRQAVKESMDGISFLSS